MGLLFLNIACRITIILRYRCGNINVNQISYTRQAKEIKFAKITASPVTSVQLLFIGISANKQVLDIQEDYVITYLQINAITRNRIHHKTR